MLQETAVWKQHPCHETGVDKHVDKYTVLLLFPIYAHPYLKICKALAGSVVWNKCSSSTHQDRCKTSFFKCLYKQCAAGGCLKSGKLFLYHMQNIQPPPPPSPIFFTMLVYVFSRIKIFPSVKEGAEEKLLFRVIYPLLIIICRVMNDALQVCPPTTSCATETDWLILLFYAHQSGEAHHHELILGHDGNYKDKRTRQW